MFLLNTIDTLQQTCRVRIEELILDGFKSYPVRTSISGWDKSFNAITGLNGSGKSNILDAICFVLGITNLQAVRAANLQDLIYKRGQAGVTKASVTIVFDNSDREKAPVGFETYKQVTVTRQVAMGGVSKYLICGHRATQNAVQNLFQSVQLNINNPNFLIMQGKITKVLNMKPPEILGMIEEAAGTSMFEDKKDKAVKTMAKKEKKIEEIQALLKEEITPKLNRLREEKRTYLEYQKAQSEFERLSRLVVAHEWLALKSKVERAGETIQGKHDEIAEGRKSAKRIQEELKRIEKEVEEITRRRDKEMQKGGKVQTLDTKLKELAKDLTKTRTQLDLKKQTIAEDEKRVTDTEAAVKELEGQREEKKRSLAKATEELASIKGNYDNSSLALKQTENLLQTLITGLSSSSNDADSVSTGYMGQIANARNKASTSATEAEQAKARIDHLQRELKEKEPRAKKAQSEDTGLTKELQKAKELVQRLITELGNLDWDENRETNLREKRENAGKAVRELLEKRDTLKGRLASLDFNYSMPSRDFDKSKVKGLVASLINIVPENYKYSTALEVCAGGRLYNVVVENEKVGSQLLENGRLTKRVTMIPLNQIQAFRASAERIATVKQVSNHSADLALSLVGYADDVSKAMEYVFGNVLVCPDAETAKRVTFHANIKMKSVTLDGDVYDPSGTLSGGSKPSTSGILVKVQELKAVEDELNQSKRILDQAEREWELVKDRMTRYKEARRELDLKAHEVTLLEERVKESNTTRIISEVEALKEQIKTLQTSIASFKQQQKEAEQECKRLEKEMNEFKNNREGKLDELKKDISKKKADLAKQTTGVKSVQKEMQTVELELEQMDKDLETTQAEVTEAAKAVQRSKKEHSALQASIDSLQSQHDSVEGELREETKILSAFARELDELDKARKRKEKDTADLDVEEKKLVHDLERMDAENKKIKQNLINYQNKYTWIEEDSPSFGKTGTPYDFSQHDMAAARITCEDLSERQKGRSKKLNPKVMVMIDQVEKQEKELLKMYTQVEKDKRKIEETIAKLDEYKKEALTKTWEKVDGDFGGIFGELLPGNFAKLQPPDGQDITQGLEVKVRLGNVWKQSLTELSGGQRSLIALSLIMSLLQFKPAPMYILDEVDAALDLSHTQHIGHLFRTRFHGSQFIVVSLKEGLFTNANVLFRTRFRDGTSICERTAQRSTNPTTADMYRDAGNTSVTTASGKSGRSNLGIGGAPVVAH